MISAPHINPMAALRPTTSAAVASIIYTALRNREHYCVEYIRSYDPRAHNYEY